MTETKHVWGASALAWAHWANKLGLAEHLLPVVSNPAATISPDSNMTTLGKTPSEYNFRRQARGIPKWTQSVTSAQQIERWANESDLGICVQTRALRAIDIDVENPRRAQRIVTHIERVLPWHIFPMRSRPDSGKILLPFLFDAPLAKRVIPVEGGIIEFLGDGQQFVAVGTHTSGQRYTWGDALPEAFPLLDIDDFDTLWESLCTAFLAEGETPRIARERREIKDMDLPDVADPVANWLIANWEVLDHGADGQLYCTCPFHQEHTTDTGATSTAYFPAGTGGYQQGHWVCLHAHCLGRDDTDFNEATGYTRSLFPDLTLDYERDPAVDGGDEGQELAAPIQRQWLKLDVAPGKLGGYLPTMKNIKGFLLREDMLGWWIAYDQFLDALIWAEATPKFADAQWTAFTDNDYVDIWVRLEEKGFRPFGKEMLRMAVHRVAAERTIDSAHTWLTRLEWDGVPRVDRFMHEYLGTIDDDYNREVGRYAWSAMAARAMTPGCQADMAVILVGAQGVRKTSAVKAMAPHPEMYTTLGLHEDENDQSRRLRGKLVGELEELKGLNSKTAETIKAWVTRTHEVWVPKYKEITTSYGRRFILWGTTNDDGFLADPTGERRYLPTTVGVTREFCDVDRVIADRDQLWAEGAVIYGQQGVQHWEAERLAKGEHSKFAFVDDWEGPVAHWMETPDVDGIAPADWEGGVASTDVLVGALGVSLSQIDRGRQMRLAGVLKRLGFKRRQFGGSKEWRYKREVA